MICFAINQQVDFWLQLVDSLFNQLQRLVNRMVDIKIRSVFFPIFRERSRSVLVEYLPQELFGDSVEWLFAFLRFEQMGKRNR